MATNDHSEGIRLQAERVVRAYRELRKAPKNCDFKSDDFPIGLFAELVQQIQLLDSWLEPVGDSEPPSRRTPRQTNIERASIAIEQARRLTEVCAGSVESLNCEHSDDIAFTMNGELWGALDEARKALEGKAS